MTTERDRATILVVDDERAYVDAYTAWLSPTYDVRTAMSGRAALEAVDDVDVLLLDRRMPDLTGDEVLSRVRERGLDLPVAMITAVEPAADIVDMAFNEYLVKPVTKRDLNETVEALLDRRAYDSEVRECFALASKLAALETAHDPAELESTPEYRQLKARIEAVGARADAQLDQLIDRGLVERAFADLDS